MRKIVVPIVAVPWLVCSLIFVPHAGAWRLFTPQRLPAHSQVKVQAQAPEGEHGWEGATGMKDLEGSGLKPPSRREGRVYRQGLR
ncbi:hypothetical protein Naga_101313g1 [Nannochloropsis gaditana]|uniref:Uncharacterized protein n=1 Tax=Nannochloropsis gaditana TaxID=72520 RepID=W7TRC3_9STRA|nr:hypothetical protein Naga_101313g1 [Nannochloropsis gaditana]